MSLFGHDRGVWGEREAERHLKRKGYRIIGRRVKVGDRDEIDLLARDGEVLVFIEVKTRSSEDYGRPAAAVDAHKRRVQSRAAIRYLRRFPKRDVYFRFDVVEVIGTEEGPAPEIRHIENAFQLNSRYDFG